MKKLITLLLALVMAVSVFAACTGNKPAATTPSDNPVKDAPDGSNPAPGTGGTDVSGTPPVETDPPIDESQLLNLDLDAIDYGGEDFYLYHWNFENAEFEYDTEAEGDPVNDAIYTKILRLEEDLGITLNLHEEKGSVNNHTNFVDKLELRLSDPETPVDVIACYSRCSPYLLVQGYFVDLVPYGETIDLTKEWWPNLLSEQHNIKDRIFFISGDASTGLLFQMQAVFMNKDLFKNFGNDYDAFMTDVINVKKGSGWTIDAMIDICKDLYQDLDGVTGETAGDFYGVVGDSYRAVDTLYTGFGLKLFDISSDEDKLYTVSTDLMNSAALDVCKKLGEWAQTPDALIFEGDSKFENPIVNEMFGSAQVLFWLNRLSPTHFYANTMEVDYTVIPAPKLNEDQERYYTVVGNPYSLYGICSESKNKDRSAEFIQYLGYLGWKHTTPAILDATFKGKYAKDDYTIDTFDEIRKAISFEVGRTFDQYTDTYFANKIQTAVCKNVPWTSVMSAASVKLFNKQLSNKVDKTLLDIINRLE